MKLFRFSDDHTPRNILGHFIAEGENLYYYFNSDTMFEIRPSARGYRLRGVDNNYQCIAVKNDDSHLYIWDIYEDKVTQMIDLPKGRLYEENLGDNYIYSNNNYANIIYTVWNQMTDQRIDVATGRGGSLIHYGDDLICYLSREKHQLVAQDRAGNIKWTRRHKKQKSYVSVWPEKSIIIDSQKGGKGCLITVLDITSGSELLQYDTTERIRFCDYDGDCAYIRCTNHLIVYNEGKNAIIHDLYSEIDIAGTHVQGDRLFLVTQSPIQIEVYDKSTFERLAIKCLTALDGYSSLMATAGSRHLLAIFSNVPEEKRGFTWIGYFTDAELFSDDWVVEIEPAYYHIQAQDDFSGGVSMEVTFDSDIDFDTLYRHVSTGLQTAAFRNGFYQFIDDKTVNEQFNGIVIANFEGHTFDDKQKSLIEDLCERTTKVLQEAMYLRAGDGSRACYVTSIIPVPVP